MTTTAADIEKAAMHAGAMLDALGIVGDDQTASRLVRALDELARHRDDDPARHLSTRSPPVSHTRGRVVVTDVPFVSLCEHHMLPFTGVATLGYLPLAAQPIVGLSKLARLVQEYAARPQVQERLTDQVCAALADQLGPAGAACAVRGVHACMALRGARAGVAAAMVTTRYVGALADDPWRGEFAGRLNTVAWQG